MTSSAAKDMLMVLPFLDTTCRISEIPTVVRYHFTGRVVYGLATEGMVDFATFPCNSFSEASRNALYLGHLYKVREWRGKSRIFN